MAIFDQAEFDVRCEWGEPGVMALAPISDVIIIVDVLSFSTCVEVAVNRGAMVYPFREKGETAVSYAASLSAELASLQRGQSRYSLSPHSLLQIPAGTRLVLPSPNGSRLTLATGNTPTLAGCLRNFRAVAQAAQTYGSRIAVIPAGERWFIGDGSLRPSFEDWVGSGAILSELNGRFSPEAQAAIATFQAIQPQLATLMQECSSGKELIAKGFPEDVALAADAGCSNCVPVLMEGCYQKLPT